MIGDARGQVRGGARGQVRDQTGGGAEGYYLRSENDSHFVPADSRTRSSTTASIQEGARTVSTPRPLPSGKLSAGAYGRGRLTPQRHRVAEVASEMGAFTVHELAARLAAESVGMGLATVYRAVGALEAAGSLQTVGKRGASDLYVWCVTEGHHHHLVCTRCGAVEHAPCPFGDAQALPSELAGFTVTRHDMTLYGLCPTCGPSDKAD